MVAGTDADQPEAWHRSLSLLASGRIQVEPVITHRLPLFEARNRFELAVRKEAVKILFIPLSWGLLLVATFAVYSIYRVLWLSFATVGSTAKCGTLDGVRYKGQFGGRRRERERDVSYDILEGARARA